MMKSSGGGVFTLRSFHASSGPPPDLNAFTCPNCSTKVGKERTYDVKYKHILPYFKGKEGIPAIFLEYYPKISISDFKLIKKDNQFLERKARVCDTCYIEFTEVLQSRGSKLNTPPVTLTSSPKLSRSLSSSGNTGSIPPSPFGDKLPPANGSSPPTSPSYSNSPKAPPIFNKSPPQTKNHLSSSHGSTYSSYSSSSPSSSLSPASSPTASLSHTNHTTSSLSKRVQKSGNYKDSYYLSLYEELDSLRKELHDLKTQEESSADQLAKQLKEKEEELRAQRKVQAQKLRQETQQKDEQIRELQERIEEMRKEHAQALEAVAKEFEKKMECKVSCFEQEKERLEATIGKLKQEKEGVQKQSEAKIEADRTEVLAEVEKLKQRFDMEKTVEKEQLRAKFREDMEISKKKQEEKANAFKQQISGLESSLAQEKSEKERLVEEKRELARQLELLKAKSRVEGK